MTKVDYRAFTDDSLLTDQEKEVLKYRKEGVPGRQIAGKLGIKIESVWSISHKIVMKCTGQYDPKKHYEYTKKSLEKNPEPQKKYYQKNKEKFREYRKKYYQENKEKWKKYQEASERKSHPKKEEILEMYFDGKNASEIAKILGMKYQTAYGVLRRERKKMIENIMKKYIKAYPHLENLKDDKKLFAENALRLAAPEAVSIKEVFELVKGIS